MPRRIALLHLESLACLPALDILFTEAGERICLVVVSRRFGSRQGSIWKQAVHGIRRSGARLTLALGFDIVAPCVVRWLVSVARWDLAGRRRLRTVPELAAACGARYLETADVNDGQVALALAACRPDLVVSFHFDQILHQPLIDAVGVPIVNVHPAPLPDYRGPCPSFWVLDSGERRTGVTLHRIVDAGIDEGAQLDWTEVAVPRPTSMMELDAALFVAGARRVVALARGEQFSSRALAGATNAYRSFPSRPTVRAAWRRGVRFWRLRHATALLGAALGLWRRSGYSNGHLV